MSVWLLVLLVVLAIHRLTRLMVADEFPLIKIPRDATVNWLDPIDSSARKAPWGTFGRSVAYLMTCPWCMSIWVGGGVVGLVWWTVGLPVPWLVWLAASSVTGWAASAESEHEQRHELNDQRIQAAKVIPR